MLVFLFLMAASSPAGVADDVARGERALFVLASGEELFGRLVLKNSTSYFLKVEDRIRQVAVGDVARIVPESGIRAEYARRLKALDGSADAHHRLGVWCRNVGLLREWARHIRETLGIDPSHKAAREELELLRKKDLTRVPWKPEDSIVLRLEVRARAGKSAAEDSVRRFRLKSLLDGAHPPFTILPPDDGKTVPDYVLRAETAVEVTGENRFYGGVLISRTLKAAASLAVLDPKGREKRFEMKPVSVEESFTARERDAEERIRDRAFEGLLKSVRSHPGFRLARAKDANRAGKRGR